LFSFTKIPKGGVQRIFLKKSGDGGDSQTEDGRYGRSRAALSTSAARLLAISDPLVPRATGGASGLQSTSCVFTTASADLVEVSTSSADTGGPISTALSN